MCSTPRWYIKLRKRVIQETIRMRPRTKAAQGVFQEVRVRRPQDSNYASSKATSRLENNHLIRAVERERERDCYH
jgi:hypothetical protein